jgi:hypothetical protein
VSLTVGFRVVSLGGIKTVKLVVVGDGAVGKVSDARPTQRRE